MQITDFHAKYYAFLLSMQGVGDSVDSLAATLSDASVDLLPHQIEAALFAFHNPLSKGVIFGDEVGLGKTIEAGLVIAQKWSEGKKKVIVVVPATLRRQWQLELAEKFFLPSIILDRKAYDEIIKTQKNPFEQEQIIITSYHFAANCGMHIREIQWDLAVIDEAHRIRNCYKDGNVIAKSLNDSLNNRFKLLLTATPLQNSLLELYGLVSFIDDLTFGDVDSFKYQYSYDRNDDKLYGELADRVKKVCIRTLRRQVLEYIKYTNRIPITQEFSPTPDEQKLYDKVSRYLQRDTYAMPYGQRHLIALILWKLLASSTFAIAATLQTLVTRLECKLEDNDKSAPPLNFDGLLDDEMILVRRPKKKLTAKDILGIKAEIEELKEYADLAKSIKNNAKGDALLIALETGFKKLKVLGANQKAVIRYCN